MCWSRSIQFRVSKSSFDSLARSHNLSANWDAHWKLHENGLRATEQPHLKRAPAAPVGSNSERQARLSKHWSVRTYIRNVHRSVSAAWGNGRHTCSRRTEFTGFATRRALEPPPKYRVSARQAYMWYRVIAGTHRNDYLVRRWVNTRRFITLHVVQCAWQDRCGQHEHCARKSKHTEESSLSEH